MLSSYYAPAPGGKAVKEQAAGKARALMRLLFRSEKSVTGQTPISGWWEQHRGDMGPGHGRREVPIPPFRRPLFDARRQGRPEAGRTGWGPCLCISAQVGAVLFSLNVSPANCPSSRGQRTPSPRNEPVTSAPTQGNLQSDRTMNLTTGTGERVPSGFLVTQKD